MSRYSYFPRILPNAFVSLPTANPKQPRRYFLDIIAEHTPRRALDARLSSYCQFLEEDGWDITGSELPTLLLVADKGVSETFLYRSARALLKRTDMEDLRVLTSTVNAVLANDTDKIWTDTKDIETLISMLE